MNPTFNPQGCMAGGLGVFHAEAFHKAAGIVPLPPGLAIPDQKLKHEVLGEVLLVGVLQDEAEALHLQDRDLVVLKHRAETERLIISLGEVVILRGHEGP